MITLSPSSLQPSVAVAPYRGSAGPDQNHSTVGVNAEIAMKCETRTSAVPAARKHCKLRLFLLRDVVSN